MDEPTSLPDTLNQRRPRGRTVARTYHRDATQPPTQPAVGDARREASGTQSKRIASSDCPLEIRGLRKSYGAIEALRGVDFSLQPGERLGFLGPNGAGKTTLIRCIAGRTRPSSGSLSVFGHAIGSKISAQQIGLIPQDVALYEDLTARENLFAFGKFHGLGRRELNSRVSWALQWMGLESRSGELVGGFSGGMKRRVNIACGVLHRPRIILLDEPTVGVDPQSRQRIFEMLDELNHDGASLLLTTHHLDEAEQRTDRIVIIDQGRIVANGAFQDLVDQTVGRSRIVRVRLDRAAESKVLFLDSPLDAPAPDRIEARLEDTNVTLRALLDAIHAQGYGVSDLEVQSPSLHHVFLHLTGHDLRD